MPVTFIDTELKRLGVPICWLARVTNFDQASPLMVLLFNSTKQIMGRENGQA